MKKSYIILTTILSAVTLAKGGLILNESFEVADSKYEIGALTGQGPVVEGVIEKWINDENAIVGENSLSYNDVRYRSSTGGSVTIPARSRVGRQGRRLGKAYTDDSEGVVYLSFLMQTTPNQQGSYRAFELHNFGFDDKKDRRFQLGYQDGDFSSDGKLYGFRVNDVSTTLGENDGEVKLFVVKFEFSKVADGDSVTVWQNPDLKTDGDPAGGIKLSGFDMQFDRFTFSKFGRNGGVSWDEVRMGDTFKDVTVLDPSK